MQNFEVGGKKTFGGEIDVAANSGNIDLGPGGVFVVIGGTESAIPTDPLERSDFSGDGKIGFEDFITFAGAFGKSSQDSDFNPRTDLNGDGQVNFQDFIIFAGVFGRSVGG